MSDFDCVSHPSKHDIDAAPPVAMRSRREGAIEWGLRSFAVVAYLLMLLAIFNNWRESGHAYSLLMLLVTEGFTLSLILSARRAVARDASPALVLAVIYTSSYFLFLDPGDSIRVIPDSAGATMQGIGLGLTLVSKAQLGRAFGVLPAVRGLVCSGPYRLVRHPIYLGYLIGNIGFLLANASMHNALVLTALGLVHILRIFREEAIFERSDLKPAYDLYCSRVRFRLIPGVF